MYGHPPCIMDLDTELPENRLPCPNVPQVADIGSLPRHSGYRAWLVRVRLCLTGPAQTLRPRHGDKETPANCPLYQSGVNVGIASRGAREWLS